MISTLVLAANPNDIDRLRLDEDVRAISAAEGGSFCRETWKSVGA
jgi:hypothetical protein